MFNSELITQIFKVINLLVFIGLAFYLFKKYILNVVKLQMFEEAQKTQNLEKQIINVDQEIKEVDSEISHQKEEARLLMEDIEKWVEEIEAAQNAEKKENKEREKASKDRAKKQEKNLTAQELKRRLATVVAEKIEELIKSELKDLDHQKYISGILKQFKEIQNEH